MDLARKQYPALTGYLERLEAAYRSNTTLDPIEDIDHLAAIIKGLNIADPMLNLHFDKICAEDTPENIRVRIGAETGSRVTARTAPTLIERMAGNY